MANLVSAEAAKACQLGNIHKLQSYLKKTPALLNGCDIEGNTLLTLACRENRIKIVELLLNPPYSANINQANQTGYSPLITAATEGHLNLVELLLSRGANINQQNNNGWTALMCACCFRRIEIIQKLLDSSATVNTASNTGCTALYLACSAGSEKAVELLLQHSAEPNICSNSGCSPLHLAAENSNKPIIALLIEGGASTSALDHQDRTPLQVARNEDVRKFIRNTYQEHIEHPKPKKPLPPKKPPRISKSLKSTDTSPNNETTTPTTIIPAPEIASVQPSSSTELVSYSSGSLTTSETRQPPVQFNQYQDLLQQLSSLNYENLQYLSQTSSKSLHYLTDLSNEALSLKYEWKYIQSQPFLAEYYSYCQRCFTSVILSLQVLLSDNIADNRTTTTETVFSTIDTIANATGINCLPLVTALVKYIVSIPFNRDRKKTIENITTFFPSISSHQIIDLFIHEITLLEEKNIQSIMRINKKIKKFDLIEKLYENQQLISWMFEEVKLTFFPQSSSSSSSSTTPSSLLSQNKFSYTIIQAYADIQLSRIFTKLMYHPGDEYKKSSVDEVELKRQAVSKEMMWQLHCIALDLPLTKENEEKITTDLARIHETFQRKRYEEESLTPPQISSPSPPLTITIANPAIPAPEVKELPRPSSVRYRDIIVSLEEKLSILQEQLQEAQRHSSLMSTQQQQEIVVMKEQLERVSQLQEQQQQLQQFQPTSSASSPSPPPTQSGGRRSSLSSPQVLLHKQDQSQKSSSVEGLEGGGSDESLIDTQTRLMMQQAYMSETLYAVIQQLQLIQDQLPPTSTSSSSVVALDEIELRDGEEEGKTAERQSFSNNNNDKTTDSERKALTRGCYCIIQ